MSKAAQSSNEVALAETFISQDTIVGCCIVGLTTVATVELGGWVRLRHSSTGAPFRQHRLRSAQDPTSIAISGLLLWVGQTHGLITILSSETLNPVADCVLHEKGVTSIVNARTVMISTCADGNLAKWCPESMKCISSSTIRAAGPLNCALPSEHGIFVHNDRHEVVLLSTEQLNTKMTFEGHTQEILSLAVCDRTLWSGSQDETIRCWSIETSHCLRVLTYHSGPVHCLHITDNEKRIWSASMDGRVGLWDSTTFSLVAHVPIEYPPGPTQHFTFVVMTASASTMYNVWTCGTDGTVRGWVSASPASASQSVAEIRAKLAEAVATIAELKTRAPFTEEQLLQFMQEKKRDYESTIRTLKRQEVVSALEIRMAHAQRALAEEEACSRYSILACWQRVLLQVLMFNVEDARIIKSQKIMDSSTFEQYVMETEQERRCIAGERDSLRTQNSVLLAKVQGMTESLSSYEAKIAAAVRREAQLEEQLFLRDSAIL